MTTDVIEEALNNATKNLNETDDRNGTYLRFYLSNSLERAHNNESFNELKFNRLTYAMYIDVLIDSNKRFTYTCSVNGRINNDREDIIDPVISGYLNHVNNRAKSAKLEPLNLADNFDTKSFNYKY